VEHDGGEREGMPLNSTSAKEMIVLGNGHIGSACSSALAVGFDVGSKK
jgi:hypothetical protein